MFRAAANKTSAETPTRRTTSSGVKSLTCTAADNAGNTSSSDLNYVVGYAIDSVTLHPEGAVRPGSILEIRFQAVDAKGETISDSIAKNLDRAVTAALGTAIAAAEYNPAKDQFEAELKISPKIVAGVYPLVINIRQGSVNLGTATVSVTVGK